MKIVVVGIGQAGGRIADAFYDINNYAKNWFVGRRIEILTDTFIVNTDTADLTGISHIPSDKIHRKIIGSDVTRGHGVGKDAALGAEIMKGRQSGIADAIRNSKKYDQADAIVAIASSGGGTGAGGIGFVIKELKENLNKPVYAILVLPFKHEEGEANSLAIPNSARCLRTVINHNPDAIFLLDNRKFGSGEQSILNIYKQINDRMVKNFYDLFCAGEEKNPKYIGGKVVDAGDIMKSLEGFTTIGRGVIHLSAFYSLRKGHFREGSKEDIAVIEAFDQAIGNFCFDFKETDLVDARKILCLVCAPKEITTLNALEGISARLKKASPEAEVRIGDYPRRDKEISVTVIASKLIRSARINELYTQAPEILKRKEEIDKQAQEAIQAMHDKGKDIPSFD